MQDYNIFYKYVLMLLLLMVSGMPLYMHGDNVKLGVFIIIGIVFFIKNISFYFINRSFINGSNLLVLVSFSFVIFVIQFFKFNFFPLETILGFYIYVLTAYMVVTLLGNSFIAIYIRAMYYIAILSLIFYFALNLNILNYGILDSFSLKINSARDVFSFLGVFTFFLDDIQRNSGIFWEPGAFGGYLIIALMFNFFISTRNKLKYNIVFITAILSTLSSSSYIAAIIFFSIIKILKYKSIALKIISLILMFILGLFVFFNTSILSDKITSQIKIAEIGNAYGDNNNTQRFLNLLRDKEDIEGHVLFGRGLNPETRYLYKKEDQIRTVGLTDFFVRFGIFFYFFIFVTMFMSIRRILLYYHIKRKAYSYLIFSIICILLFSEVYFNYAFFWSFVFFGITYKSKFNFKKNTIIS
tara:strand:+ start:1079 stop:2314 length:1236 start_codon:yes stop_codon:yes gene_type:complete